MAEPFLGEVRIFSFNFPPRGWAFCSGQTLPINQYQALFAILGTTYGGDGRTNFKLPNLQGRIPYGTSNGVSTGTVGGEEYHTLLSGEIPMHTHIAMASQDTAPNIAPVLGNIWCGQTAATYGTAQPVAMSAQAIGIAGGSQPHENRPPYAVLNFCIALSGLFPSRG